MPDSVDVETVLLLMEHFLELHHKQIQEATERLTGLARSIGIEKHVDESLDSLVERVRKFSRGEFTEEPPTTKERVRHPLVQSDMVPTGPEEEPQSKP